MWEELRDVVLFWVDQGVRIFRVDNPHTKPFAFWEWLIADIQPDASRDDLSRRGLHATEGDVSPGQARLHAVIHLLHLAEPAATRLAEYLEEVTSPPVRDFFRPNFWPNTPDILHATLQEGGRPMFLVRLALAALSAGNWGIYGPAMELMAATPREPGSEEYLDSEKYEIKAWDLQAPESLAPFVRRLNELRRSEPALARNRPPVIQPIDDPDLLAWSRFDEASGSRILVVVNMQPEAGRVGRLDFDLAGLGLAGGQRATAHELLDGGAAHLWHLPAVSVECPPERPVRVFRVEP